MIAEVGNLLVKILRRELIPDVIPHSSNIGLCSPEDHGDLQLGVYLYDISENEDIRVSGMVNEGINRQVFPPTYLSLHYMLTAYSASDIKARASEEQKILGRVIQVFHDYNVLPEGELGDGASMPARIELQRMERFEKMRLWNMPNIPYRLSLFYRVQPVEIVSAKTKEISRVRDVDFSVKEE